jgi:hypothetical protein
MEAFFAGPGECLTRNARQRADATLGMKVLPGRSPIIVGDDGSFRHTASVDYGHGKARSRTVIKGVATRNTGTLNVKLSYTERLNEGGERKLKVCKTGRLRYGLKRVRRSAYVTAIESKGFDPPA